VNLGFWKFPDQVVRLSILFTVAIATLVWARQRFVPPSFGERGHYRFDAVQANADAEIHYAGRQACVECHTDHGDLITTSYHRTLSCEVCHASAVAHVEDPEAFTPATPRQRGRACLYCHDYLPSRPTGFPQIIERQHNPLEPCINCHDPHDPTPPETPGACSACHGQIARTKAISHHGTLECATCHSSDPEHYVNPRSARPSKPSERQFCAGCHASDANSPRHIPRIEVDSHGGRYLCWQCHYPHRPEA
jgi:hypothetical protein